MTEELIFCETCGDSVEAQKYSAHIKHAHLPKKEFICDICFKEFPRQAALNNHKARHFNERNYSCDLCTSSFNTNQDLYSHKKTTHKMKHPSTYNCEYCSAVYHSKLLFSAHLKTHIVPTAKECQFCQKTFISNSAMNNHIRQVHPSNYHKCPECDKEFKVKHGLDTHISNVHRKERKHTCLLCDKSYSEIKNLKLHQKKIHATGGTSIYCPLCKDYFDDIKSHYDIMHADLQKKCSACFMRFSTIRHLKRHVERIHKNGKRKWICGICSKGFVVKFELQCHIKKGHKDLGEEVIAMKLESLDATCDMSNRNQDEENKIGCNVCGEMIDDFLYNSHMMSFHEDQVDESFMIIEIPGEEKSIERDVELSEVNENGECHICSKKFNIRRSLVRHIKNVHKNKEANQCHVCRKEVDNVKKHYEKLHSYLLFTCTICYRKFRSKLILDRHKEFNHVMARNYRCDLCGKTFISKNAISRHITVHEND